MGFYDDPDKVTEYEKMCKGYDGLFIHDVLNRHLNDGSSVLEIGSGPGNDIPYLKRHYTLTGSDLSGEFLRRLKIKYPDIPFLQLDAVSIETPNQFDCIFSNKMLHHLTTEQLKHSLRKQTKVIKKNGIISHTFWIGDKEFTQDGLLFVFHNREKLLRLISKYFNIVETLEYKEFEDGDSIFIIALNNLDV